MIFGVVAALLSIPYIIIYNEVVSPKADLDLAAFKAW
jgi:hypothetical protein